MANKEIVMKILEQNVDCINDDYQPAVASPGAADPKQVGDRIPLSVQVTNRKLKVDESSKTFQPLNDIITTDLIRLGTYANFKRRVIDDRLQ